MKTIRELLRQARVRDIGRLRAPRLSPDGPISDAVRLLVEARRGAVVVTEGDRPVGIFTERDVLTRMGGSPPRPAGGGSVRPVRDVMSPDPVAVSREATLIEAVGAMVEGACRHLVVVDGAGDLLGLLTSADIVQFLADQFPEHTVNLPPRLRQSFGRAEGA